MHSEIGSVLSQGDRKIKDAQGDQEITETTCDQIQGDQEITEAPTLGQIHIKEISKIAEQWRDSRLEKIARAMPTPAGSIDSAST